MAKVLLVEDDARLAEELVDLFKHEMYKIDAVHTAEDAANFLKTYDYDAVVLDWNLPDGSGMNVLREFRQRSKKTPVLVLTGNSQLADKEFGYDTGADDYLTKPFDARELFARVRALIRRSGAGDSSEILRAGALELNLNLHQLTKNGVPLKLRPTEFALLEYLMRHCNRAHSPESLLAALWTSEGQSASRTVRITVSRLRTQIDDEGEPSLIESVPGQGYRMRKI
ncbi:MAG TPA: response regulator transcription factor [Chroococcales cyanobacterium]